MAYIELHTSLLHSPKHTPLSDGAFRLWVQALLWSQEQLTDGFIPAAMLATLHPRAKSLVTELLRTSMPGKGPLFHAVEGGYRVHDFEDWNDTKADVQARRRFARDRQAKRRQASVESPCHASVTPSVTRDNVCVSRVTSALVTPKSLTDTVTDPVTGGSKGEASPPRRPPTLVGRRHLDAAFDWRVPVPQPLHASFIQRLGGNPVEADATLQRWYQAVALRIGDGDTGGLDDFAFWRAEFAHWRGAAGASPTGPPHVWTCGQCGQPHRGTRAQKQAGWCPTREAAAS